MSTSSEQKMVLFIGGCRSGKSRLAEEYVDQHFKRPCYVATMQHGSDKEMQERIRLHQERRGDTWTLVEEPLDLCSVLEQPLGDGLLIDCLSMWLTNLLLRDRTDQELNLEFQRLRQALERCPVPVVMVANEVGLGIVPDNILGRRFRDLAGLLNQQIAKLCCRVVFVAAGLPLLLKDD